MLASDYNIAGYYPAFMQKLSAPVDAARPCFCVGPRNGDPVCPCRMPEYNRRKMADMALDILTRAKTKPRFRVKAGRRVVDADAESDAWYRSALLRDLIPKTYNVE